jgi:hypothetical protein
MRTLIFQVESPIFPGRVSPRYETLPEPHRSYYKTENGKVSKETLAALLLAAVTETGRAVVLFPRGYRYAYTPDMVQDALKAIRDKEENRP